MLSMLLRWFFAAGRFLGSAGAWLPLFLAYANKYCLTGYHALVTLVSWKFSALS